MKHKRKEAAAVKFRRAATLVATFQNNRIAVHNFLTHDSFTCSSTCLELLSLLDDWHKPEELFVCMPDIDRSSLAAEIPELIKLNALVLSGTPQAALDKKYRHEWQWGTSAGFFHFSIRNTRFITGAPARALMRNRKKLRRSPPLHQPNKRGPYVTKLPHTDLRQEPFSLMRARRSQRQFKDISVSMQSLADCLFSGNGIVEFSKDKDYGRLPLTMTPSGGARNPFELYVYARNVTDLEPGFYHYGALRHDLGLVRAGVVNVPAMMGTQKWPAKAAAIIFLVANFPRTMWKYHMPIAYRVVMMEAGFIGQNIALTATHYGLSAIPSGALSTSLVEGYLGTPAVESGVVLSLSIGIPKVHRP